MAGEKFTIDNEYQEAEKMKFNTMREKQETKNQLFQEKEWIKKERRENIYKAIQGDLKGPLMKLASAVLSSNGDANKEYSAYLKRMEKFGIKTGKNDGELIEKTPGMSDELYNKLTTKVLGALLQAGTIECCNQKEILENAGGNKSNAVDGDLQGNTMAALINIFEDREQSKRLDNADFHGGIPSAKFIETMIEDISNSPAPTEEKKTEKPENKKTEKTEEKKTEKPEEKKTEKPENKKTEKPENKKTEKPEEEKKSKDSSEKGPAFYLSNQQVIEWAKHIVNNGGESFESFYEKNKNEKKIVEKYSKGDIGRINTHIRYLQEQQKKAKETQEKNKPLHEEVYKEICSKLGNDLKERLKTAEYEIQEFLGKGRRVGGKNPNITISFIRNGEVKNLGNIDKNSYLIIDKTQGYLPFTTEFFKTVKNRVREEIQKDKKQEKAEEKKRGEDEYNKRQTERQTEINESKKNALEAVKIKICSTRITKEYLNIKSLDTRYDAFFNKLIQVSEIKGTKGDFYITETGKETVKIKLNMEKINNNGNLNEEELKKELRSIIDQIITKRYSE